MENEQQVISHEQALAALSTLELQYTDVPNQELVERYIKQQQLLDALTEQMAGDAPPSATFSRAMEQLINSYSIENGSNTPDFILASLLMQTLKTWDLHTVERDRWYENRSLLGPGGAGGRGVVQASEKTLLPGVDITKPRDLIGEALGEVPTMSSYVFKTGLLGAVNNLYCFHEKFGVPWITDEPTWPGAERMRLRRKLNNEEYLEELEPALNQLLSFLGERRHTVITERQLQNQDDRKRFRSLMSTVADGIVDSIYVLIGMGGEMGLDLSEVWRRVHVANMAKEGGGKRADGKILKPEGWVAPDVEGAIFKTP